MMSGRNMCCPSQNKQTEYSNTTSFIYVLASLYIFPSFFQVFPSFLSVVSHTLFSHVNSFFYSWLSYLSVIAFLLSVVSQLPPGCHQLSLSWFLVLDFSHRSVASGNMEESSVLALRAGFLQLACGEVYFTQQNFIWKTKKYTFHPC